MSVAAIPKPSGERPPFRGGPPIKTSLSGGFPAEPDPEFVRLRDGVVRLLATVDQTNEDRLEVLLRLLEQRRTWLESELSFERLMISDPLPPMEGLALYDVLESATRAEWSLRHLLSDLDAAIRKVRTKISVIKSIPPASDF